MSSSSLLGYAHVIWRLLDQWGFRVETVCDSETSFILHMKVVGKLDEDGAPGGGRGGGKTHSLVMQMIEPFVGKNHVVIMDNRYMQVRVVAERSAELHGTTCRAITTCRR